MHKNHPLTQVWHSPTVRRARHLASPRLWFRYLTAPQRRLPEFIIAGAQKAGTTSLFGYLAGHPQCLPPLVKEVNFYDQNYARGQRWYRMHFPVETHHQRRSQAALCFEASPHYMFEPQVAPRVRQSLPSMKAIFLLRNPVHRAYSHYQHEVRRGHATKSFEDCIEVEIRQQSGEHELPATMMKEYGSGGRLSYLARGLYVDQLQNWQTHFPAEQMLVIEAERMFQDPREVFAEVLAFLGLDPWTPPQFGNLNPGRYTTSMSPLARARALSYFAPHNRRLFDFLGKRCAWRDDA